MAVKILYDIIREKRNELELSQQDLSNETDINISVIKSLETGRANTTLENTKKIAKRLGLEIDDIYIEDFRNTKVISVANNKGGSAKTSTVSSLAYALSEIDDNRILLIDGCMQMNLSYTYGFDVDDKKNLSVALIQERNLTEFIKKTNYENIDIIISDFKMATMEMILFQKILRESLLKRILDPVIESGKYDYILIDTNPTLGMLNFNILNASDFVIIPVNMSPYGLKGLDIIISYIKDVMKINTKLKIGGILKTIVDKREKITDIVDDKLDNVSSVNVFDTYISIDTNIKRGQYENDPSYTFERKTRAARQYRQLAREVMKLVK